MCLVTVLYTLCCLHCAMCMHVLSWSLFLFLWSTSKSQDHFIRPSRKTLGGTDTLEYSESWRVCTLVDIPPSKRATLPETLRQMLTYRKALFFAFTTIPLDNPSVGFTETALTLIEPLCLARLLTEI